VKRAERAERSVNQHGQILSVRADTI